MLGDDDSSEVFLLSKVPYTVKGFRLNAGEYLGKSSAIPLSFQGGLDSCLEYDEDTVLSVTALSLPEV